MSLGDRKMTFQTLKAQLTDLGCECTAPDRNFIKFYRDTPEGRLSVKTGYPRSDFDIAVNEVKRIRRALQLDEAHGFDSGAFYDLESAVDGLANKYRHLLDRLAEA